MSLFEISAEVRVIIKWVLIGIAGLFVAWILFISLRALIVSLTTNKEILPSTSFGKLPLPLQPNANLSKIQFDLDTGSGSLPSNPALLSVYPIPEPAGKLNSLDLAQNRVQSLGVIGKPKSISPTLYQFQDIRTPAKSITIDIVTGNFTYTFDWIADPSAVKKTFDAPVDAAAKSIATSFANSAVVGTNDLEKGETKTTYVKIAGAERTKVSSPSEANAVEVQIYRAKIDEVYRIVSTDPTKSLINALVVPENADKQVLQVNFTHWLIDFEQDSTYPLRSTNQAFEDLKKNKANVVVGKLDGVDRIRITNVELAYLETERYIPYLQPVYIFSGDAFAGRGKSNFVAYVPAISEDWLTSIQ
jgi:hypothetical protein